VLSQPLTSVSTCGVTPLASKTVCAPFLKSTALLSMSVPPLSSDDVRAAGRDALRVQAVEQALSLELADLLVVERHVVGRGTAELTRS